MNRNSIIIALVLPAVLALGGCVTQKQTYPNHTAGQVWNAMVAVAESPEYDDWRLTANEVWTSQEEARIEIYREARRTLHRAGARPQDQRRVWRFQVLLDGDDPPTATFISRGMGVPAHARAEADRYFIDVRRMLAELP